MFATTPHAAKTILIHQPKHSTNSGPAHKMAPIASQMDRQQALQQLLVIQKWARLLDARFTIPGTGIRYGWDSILGLVPWVGDAVTGLVGAVLVYLAYRTGIPQMLLWQMIANIILDVAAGSIPVVGDLFDLAFKAHIRNAMLLEGYLKEQGINPESNA